MALSRQEREDIQRRIAELKNRQERNRSDISRMKSYIQDKYAQLNSGYRMDRYQRDGIKSEINGLKAQVDDLYGSQTQIKYELDGLYSRLRS